MSKVLTKQLNTKAKTGDELLIPITSSVYIPGKLKDNNKFLVELGTGYFAEFDCDKTQGYLDRKIEFIQDNGKKAEAQIDKKRKFIEKVNIEIQKKAQAQQAEAEKQKKKASSTAGKR